MLARRVVDGDGDPDAKVSALLVAALIAGAWLLLLGAFGRRLAADWREPVLAAPVLIVESDDWGPGPLSDADRLQKLLALLQSFRDRFGGQPVLTLGVVLAVPRGGAAERESTSPHYAPHLLDEAPFEPLRRAMLAGRDAGVFALQLHGLEHFWPPALCKAARQDASARAFLDGRHGEPRHETLPSRLQARWIDAAQLPSVVLDRGAVDRAVAEEVACFARAFGAPPRVAVPVTFTWTTDVEAAWASNGIRVVVTPGTRNTGRDAQGRLTGDGSILRNGDMSAVGIVYVVRDIYFEPALGHTAERAIAELRERSRLGRPALLETHRFNFTGEEGKTETSLAELRRLLQGALAALPELRFMSTEALAQGLVARDPALIDRRLAARVRAFVLRASTQDRLRRLAWCSGLALVAAVLLAASTALLRHAEGRPAGQ